MKYRHIYNACGVYEAQATRLVVDPWLTDGAFEGSWAAYPPLKTKPEDLVTSDILWISHIHPDHFDPETLMHFPKMIPVVVFEPAKGMNFLKNKLMDLGFKNFISLKDSESYVLPPFKFTAYGPFTTHPFDKCQMGYFIDSALVIEADGECILNANDNVPSIEAAKALRKRHGPFTLVQLKDFQAGPYPGCFQQLSNSEKLSECLRLTDRQITHALKIAHALDAKYFQSFANEFRLQGRLSNKNAFIGASDPFVVKTRLESEFPHLSYVHLKENDEIDLTLGEISIGEKNQMDFLHWEKVYATKKYPYELDSLPDVEELRKNIQKAFDRIVQKQKQFKYWPDLNFTLQVIDASYYVSSQMSFRMDNLEPTKSIIAKVPARLLARILAKKAHWNSAEVGSHIEFVREPNVYDPDFSMIMAFFHA